MAWNDSGNNPNPWDRGGGGGGGSGNRQGSPDLDRLLRDWQKKLAQFLRSGRGGRPGGGEGGSGSGKVPGKSGFMAIGALIFVGWLLTGLYRVDDAQRAVVLRFGKFVATADPGLRWHVPWPVERVELVNINEISPFNKQTRMLTADENIVDVDMVVQYQKADPIKYLFQVRSPEGTISDVSESAIREIIGKSKLDFALGEGRGEIALQTERLIQQTLDEYNTGIRVTKVNLQDVNFPEQVNAAVQDAIKAREDRERLAFEAQAYANDVVPRARGEAARRLANAEAYKERVTVEAQGEAARFESLLHEYEQAPAVTRDRLYIEAIEDVLSRTAKVLVDTKGNGNSNMIYLPVDKILENRRQQASAASQTKGAARQADAAAPAAAAEMEVNAANAMRAREDLRNRETRR